MQFKNPEILYALFLLLIPVIIHLFRLRRFQKVEFTNVAFLKKVVIQTRKSSQIKKWLALFLRLMALALIILAFAQPFFKSDQLTVEEVDTVIYLDNSFSLQSKSSKGSLLENATQDLYRLMNENHNLSWFTNDNEYRNVSSEDFKSQILKTQHSSHTLSPQEVLLKADRFFSSSKGKKRQVLYISDFASNPELPEPPAGILLDVVQLKPAKIGNIAIDTAFITSRSGNKARLKVMVSKQGETASEVPVSIYNGEQLIGKSNVVFNDHTRSETEFELDITEAIQGKITIPDPEITFDNDLYFSINESTEIKVLAINENDSRFLRRLFNEERFDYQESSLNQLNFSLIPDRNFIVLNGLKEISAPLAAALDSFIENGGNLLIIPGREAEITSYNAFLSKHQLGNLSPLLNREKKITRISFSNPLFENVFEKEVTNFQYPSVSSSFELSSTATPLLFYEDNKPFLIGRDAIYLFSASLDNDNSNFINSPLVVPTIYNMGLRSLPLPEIYYEAGTQNQIAIPIQLGNNEILKMADDRDEFIPIQQVKSSHVLITTDEMPSKAGTYRVLHKENTIKTLSYNINREEGVLNYADLSNWSGAGVHTDIPALFSNVYESDSAAGLWKWFVIFALVFLILEMLVLKYMK